MAAKTSKFKGIFDAAQDPEPEETAIARAEPVSAAEEIAAATPVIGETAPQASSPPTPPTGRPANGKKSDPRYKQVTAYVRKDLHRNVTGALFDDARCRDDAKRQEFSELVDALLERWWQERNTKAD